MSQSFSFSPVEPATLRQRIAERIREAVLSGDLKPGSRIVELKLSQQMNVAQSTVREALQDLLNEGLLVKRVNRETLVRRLTPSDLKKLFHVRIELECLAVESAHSLVNEQALHDLSAIVEEMRRSARSKRIEDFYKFDIAFHRYLWAMADNEFLERALIPLSVGPIAFALAGFDVPLKVNYVEIAEDHAAIVDALAKGTPKTARQVMQEKLLQWREVQMKGLGLEEQQNRRPDHGPAARLQAPIEGSSPVES